MPKTSDRRKTRDIAAAIAHVLAHPVRVDILSVLQEGGAASQKDLADQLQEPLSNITHHINELREAGAIEVAFSKRVGNVEQHYWRAIETSTYQAEDKAAMTPEEHESFSRIVVQSIMAEALASLRAGKLSGDPYVATAWDRVWLDEQGYKDLSDSTSLFFNRMYDIVAESATRMKETGEKPKPYIGVVMAFERARREPNTTVTVGHLGKEA